MNEKKIKILFGIGRLSVGGGEKLLVYQLNALSKEKFDPRLVTLSHEEPATFADRARIDRSFEFRSVTDLRTFVRLCRYIRGGRFDVVVTSLFSANLLVRLAAVVCRVPVIVAYEHNVYPDKRRWQIFMDRFLAKRTRLILTDSEAARVFTAKQEDLPLDKFMTLYIPPLLDAGAPRDARAVRREIGIPDTAPVILTVSRLVEEKGHAYLIEAAGRVLATYPDVCVVIVGWGPLEHALKEQIRQLGLTDRIKMPGNMDINDVLPLADIYVEPAISTDLPVAVMEAMRMGKAIVATNISEIPVFIESMQTGLLVPPKDPVALAEAIGRLLEDPALRAKLGTQAAQRVQKFSLEEYMRTFETLIASFVQETRT